MIIPSPRNKDFELITYGIFIAILYWIMYCCWLAAYAVISYSFPRGFLFIHLIFISYSFLGLSYSFLVVSYSVPIDFLIISYALLIYFPFIPIYFLFKSSSFHSFPIHFVVTSHSFLCISKSLSDYISKAQIFI